MSDRFRYKTEYCDLMVERMADGLSLREFASEIGVTLREIKRWRDEIPEFADAAELGEEASQAWWEKQGRVNLHNKDMNNQLWQFNMKNRCGWGENNKEGTTNVVVAMGLVEHDGKAIDFGFEAPKAVGAPAKALTSDN